MKIYTKKNIIAVVTCLICLESLFSSCYSFTEDKRYVYMYVQLFFHAIYRFFSAVKNYDENFQLKQNRYVS